MSKRQIYDDELHAQFVTFSCYRRRQLKQFVRAHLHDYWQTIDPKEPFWQAKYYSFNVYSEDKAREKLEYMHLNPVRAELVERACDWRWSSARYYEDGSSVGVPIAWVF